MKRRQILKAIIWSPLFLLFPKLLLPKDKTEQKKQDDFASAGEFFHAVKQAGTPGGAVDPRLTPL